MVLQCWLCLEGPSEPNGLGTRHSGSGVYKVRPRGQVRYFGFRARTAMILCRAVRQRWEPGTWWQFPVDDWDLWAIGLMAKKGTHYRDGEKGRLWALRSSSAQRGRGSYPTRNNQVALCLLLLMLMLSVPGISYQLPVPPCCYRHMRTLTFRYEV